MKLFAFVLGLSFLTLIWASAQRLDEGHRLQRRTVGSAARFINCLAIGESLQRICSYDLDLLNAIERQQKGGNRSCPEGKIFHRQCNVCKCRRNGAFECSTDLCGEDFFDATGLPRYW